MDPAGCVQVAEETLSQSVPDLQRLLQAARHHRYRLVGLDSTGAAPPQLMYQPAWPASPSASTPSTVYVKVNHVPNEVPQGHPGANDTLPAVADQR